MADAPISVLVFFGVLFGLFSARAPTLEGYLIYCILSAGCSGLAVFWVLA